jgi:hypothetical protein
MKQFGRIKESVSHRVNDLFWASMEDSIRTRPLKCRGYWLGFGMCAFGTSILLRPFLVTRLDWVRVVVLAMFAASCYACEVWTAAPRSMPAIDRGLAAVRVFNLLATIGLYAGIMWGVRALSSFYGTTVVAISLYASFVSVIAFLRTPIPSSGSQPMAPISG